MATDAPYVLIVNPSSGGGRGARLRGPVERELDYRHLAFRTVLATRLEHGIEEALAAAEANELPVVLGGDGLIGQVGGALARTQTPLGIVPGGRGNDLARVLGIPTDPAGAVAVLAKGNRRRIDVGEVNGRRFLGIASTGFDSEANGRANRARLVRGNLVYAYAALRTLVSWRPASFTVVLDDEQRIHHSGYSVAVANSKAYGGGMFLAPDAELDDGLFDIVLTGRVGKLRFLANLPKVFRGTHVHEDEVSVRRASRVEVRASRPFEVYADGEPLTELPAKLRLLRGALEVIAPPPTAA
ncbi:MAG TPA: YegS/Rv2252/BmrU family lipid kinase [Solirubrobacterales bacterium]|nr:YegS/Rv2252/BmrU family lipid kinase [Solirubrobacterales bacterium]